MGIRLVALDLDGTLLNSQGELTARNRAAIGVARGRGVSVVLVTGRRFRDARPLSLELGLDVPVVSHNGALTKHARTLETVAAILLQSGTARAVVRTGRAHGADALVSDDHEGEGLLVYDHISDDNTALAKYIAWSRRVVGPGAAASVRRVPSLAEYLDHDPLHIAFSGGCAAMERLGEVLDEEMGGAVKLLLTLYPKMDFALLDVLHPEASKGAGLAAIAAAQGVTREEGMGVGDNFNDLEMLEYAGRASSWATPSRPCASAGTFTRRPRTTKTVSPRPSNALYFTQRNRHRGTETQRRRRNYFRGRVGCFLWP